MHNRADNLTNLSTSWVTKFTYTQILSVSVLWQVFKLFFFIVFVYNQKQVVGNIC